MKSFPRGPLTAAAVAVLVLSGCVTDRLVEIEEGRIRAAKRELAALRAEREELRARVAELESSLGPEEAARRLSLLAEEIRPWGLVPRTRAEGISVSVSGAVLFAPGEVEVSERARPALKALARSIANHFPCRFVRVEGHSDSTAPRRLADRFPTNWEVSAARASAVARVLVREGGLDGSLVTSAAFGKHRPVADNSTPEGRQANRRVEVVILPTRRVASAGTGGGR